MMLEFKILAARTITIWLFRPFSTVEIALPMKMLQWIEFIIMKIMIMLIVLIKQLCD